VDAEARIRLVLALQDAAVSFGRCLEEHGPHHADTDEALRAVNVAREDLLAAFAGTAEERQ